MNPPKAPFDHAAPERYHHLYVKLTALPIVFGSDRRFAWELFCLRFTEDDLRTVIAFLKEKKAKRQPARSLSFRSLISGPGSLSYFEEDLAEARATRRIPVVDHGKAAILKASGREAQPQSEAVPIGKVIGNTPEEMKAFFEKCKTEAGL